MTIDQYNRSVSEFSDFLYRYILKSVKDSSVAEDIVQDCFEKLWKKRDSIDVEKIKSYLFTSAHHSIVDLFRKSGRERNCTESDTYTYGHSAQYSDIKEVLDRALTQLPAIQRSVVLLRDYEGYSYDEIAEITKLTSAQVKVYIYRARVALRKYIGEVSNII